MENSLEKMDFLQGETREGFEELKDEEKPQYNE